MKIELTLGEINLNYDWESFCKMKGYDEYCLNEGTATSNKTITLTLEEFEEIGGILQK